MVADSLAERWQLGRRRERFRGLIAEGRVPGSAPGAAALPKVADAPGTGGSGPRVAVLWPQTYMNDAGRSVGPARGTFKLPLERVVVIHDEIDIPFGDIRPRLGGGLAGHNGLKSIRRELGGAGFVRVRVGVGRPASSDPEIVSAHVLGRFREDREEVRRLVERAADCVERIVLGQESL
jgi:peptidyl-tRNA hydrolase, PTH1 family